MRLVVLIVCMGIVVSLTAGCTPSVPKAPPLATVKGTVKLDGCEWYDAERACVD
jgi:hypothetical protein